MGDGIGESETKWAGEPRRVGCDDDIGDLDAANDAAAGEIVHAREVDGWIDPGGEDAGGIVFPAGHALAGVNQATSAKVGMPGTVLNVLVTGNDEPCPGLSNGQRGA